MPHYAQSQPSYFFPTAPAAPHAFNVFAFSHSPRETHAVYEDLRGVFGGRSTGVDQESDSEQEGSDSEFVERRALKKSSSMPSFKDSLRKLLRLG